MEISCHPVLKGRGKGGNDKKKRGGGGDVKCDNVYRFSVMMCTVEEDLTNVFLQQAKAVYFLSLITKCKPPNLICLFGLQLHSP